MSTSLDSEAPNTTPKDQTTTDQALNPETIQESSNGSLPENTNTTNETEPTGPNVERGGKIFTGFLWSVLIFDKFGSY